MKYFVFVDESGSNDQENLFALGCLLVPADSIGEHYNELVKMCSKIITRVKAKEAVLERTLTESDLVNFYKGRRKAYEIKFKNINQTTAEPYQWLLSKYFKFEDVRFCCLVIDKDKYPDPQKMSFYDTYLNQLTMLLKSNIEDDDEVVILPDDITISAKSSHYEKDLNQKLTDKGKSVFGTHRLESHSSIFIQLVDFFTGAVLYDIKGGKNTDKLAVLQKLKAKTGIDDFSVNQTKQSPNYFSTWIYKRK